MLENNLYSVLKPIKKRIDKLTDLREEGEDVSEKEDAVFDALEELSYRIDEYMNTQKQTGRKFEAGKIYIGEDLTPYRVKRVTEKSIFVTQNGGAEYRLEKSPDWEGNESTSRQELRA